MLISDSYSPEFSSNPTSATSSFESIGNGGLLLNALNTLLFSYDIDFGAEILKTNKFQISVISRQA